MNSMKSSFVGKLFCPLSSKSDGKSNLDPKTSKEKSKSSDNVLDGDTVQPIRFLTHKEKRVIVKSWAKIAEHKKEFGQCIYTQVFTIKPQLKTLFPFSNVPLHKLTQDLTFIRQSAIFSQFLQSVVERIEADDATKLHTLCYWAGKRHAQISYVEFQAEWWHLFGQALQACIKQVMATVGGKLNTRQVLDAWKRLMDHNIAVMEQAFNDGFAERVSRERRLSAALNQSILGAQISYVELQAKWWHAGGKLNTRQVLDAWKRLVDHNIAVMEQAFNDGFAERVSRERKLSAARVVAFVWPDAAGLHQTADEYAVGKLNTRQVLDARKRLMDHNITVMEQAFNDGFAEVSGERRLCAASTASKTQSVGKMPMHKTSSVEIGAARAASVRCSPNRRAASLRNDTQSVSPRKSIDSTLRMVAENGGPLTRYGSDSEEGSRLRQGSQPHSPGVVRRSHVSRARMADGRKCSEGSLLLERKKAA